MEKTLRDHLLDALEDLSPDELNKFKSKLCDLKVEPRVRRGNVERKKYSTDLVDLIINTYTLKRAVDITVVTLTSIHCNQTAEELREAAESMCSGAVCAAPPPIQEKPTPESPPRNLGSSHAPPPGGYDQPDTSFGLIPSSSQFKKTITEQKESKEIYDVKEKGNRKRLALIINNVEFDHEEMRRNGAQRDEENMEKLLKALDYDVVKHTNLSGQEMDDVLKGFAGRSEHAESDSTFVVIMSHGIRGAILGVHYGPDNKTDLLPVDQIYSHLNTENCPGLRDKPKVILIQACRGGENGRVWVADGQSEDLWDMESDAWVHKEKDFVSLLSCTPDTVSYRHKEHGALFIGFLVEVFNKHAHQDNIEELFRKVMRRFDQMELKLKQMVSKDRVSLTKLFYLFPGL